MVTKLLKHRHILQLTSFFENLQINRWCDPTEISDFDKKKQCLHGTKTFEASSHDSVYNALKFAI